MRIIDFGAFTDGGSYYVNTDEGFFFLDYGIDTTTEGKLYSGFPRYDRSNIIGDDHALKLKIVTALKEYKASVGHPWTDYFIEAFEAAAGKDD